MAAPKLVSDSYYDNLENRTLSGQFNQYRTTVSEKKLPRAANDDTVVANDNEPSLYQSRADRITALEKTSAPQAGRVEIQPRNTAIGVARSRANARDRATPLPNPKTALKVAKQGKAWSTFMSIIAWGTPVYVFQFICALLLLVALGIGGIISEIFSFDQEGQGGLTSFLAGVGEFFGTTLLDLVVRGLSLLGIDLPDPQGFIGLFIFLPFMIGFGTLIGMSIQYVVTFHNPFGGQGASLKMTAFIIALIGYFLPILNLFPWALIWAFVVLRYPN